MSKRTFIISAFIILLLATLAFIFSALWPVNLLPEGNTNQTADQFRSALLKPTTKTPQDVADSDKKLLEDSLPGEGVSTEDFSITYDPSADEFSVEIYQGTLEEALPKVDAYLSNLGVQQPKKLPLQFVGPKDYNQYELVPEEKINEIMDRYSQ